MEVLTLTAYSIIRIIAKLFYFPMALWLSFFKHTVKYKRKNILDCFKDMRGGSGIKKNKIGCELLIVEDGNMYTVVHYTVFFFTYLW